MEKEPAAGGSRVSGFVRTVLGDVPADRSLGRCDAHEHVVLGGPFIRDVHSDYDLSDLDAAVEELQAYTQAGGGWVVDVMPTCCSRRPDDLAEVSRQSGVPIVMSTGRHLAQYYPAGDAHVTLDRDALRELMIREIETGVDGYRCGLIKVAGSAGGLTDAERDAFVAAAQAQQATSCPIITHTEADADGVWDQVKTLVDHGTDPSRVVLSHLDKNPDVALHRELLQAGVRLEYDQHFRRLRRGDTRAPGPFELMATIIAQHPGGIVLGMDLARRSYWRSRGGEPGLIWLLQDLSEGLRMAGLSAEQIDRCFIDNAIDAFRFDSNAPSHNGASSMTTKEPTV